MLTVAHTKATETNEDSYLGNPGRHAFRVRSALQMVLRAGLEPARPFRKLRILSPVRLPISPPEHIFGPSK